MQLNSYLNPVRVRFVEIFVDIYLRKNCVRVIIVKNNNNNNNSRLNIKLSSPYSRVRITVIVKFVIKAPLSQMEVYQTGCYMDDFRTQEVPAGFDFASFGELGL